MSIVECLLGKACCTLGGYGDGTPFGDVSIDQIGDILSEKCGLERYGNEVLYSGLTGEQMDVSFFMGPTYYQRLKHMVKDKIHSRNWTKFFSQDSCRRADQRWWS